MEKLQVKLTNFSSPIRIGTIRERRERSVISETFKGGVIYL